MCPKSKVFQQVFTTEAKDIDKQLRVLLLMMLVLYIQNFALHTNQNSCPNLQFSQGRFDLPLSKC